MLPRSIPCTLPRLGMLGLSGLAVAACTPEPTPIADLVLTGGSV